jgi:hypothetical protein
MLYTGRDNYGGAVYLRGLTGSASPKDWRRGLGTKVVIVVLGEVGVS